MADSGAGVLIEVARPEHVVLHDEGHDAVLQLRHEGVLGHDRLNLALVPLDIKLLPMKGPGESQSCMQGGPDASFSVLGSVWHA